MSSILRSTPPPFDKRLIVMLNREYATAQQGFASLAAYTARTVPACDTKHAPWNNGELFWCYVEEVPILIAGQALDQVDARLEATQRELREAITKLEAIRNLLGPATK